MRDWVVFAAVMGACYAGSAVARFAVMAVKAARSRRRMRRRLLAMSGRVQGQPHASAAWSNGTLAARGVRLDERATHRLDMAHKLNLDVAFCMFGRRTPIWCLAGDGAELPADNRIVFSAALDQTDEANSEGR